MRLVRLVFLYLLDRIVKVKNFEAMKQNVSSSAFRYVASPDSSDSSLASEVKYKDGTILNAFIVMNFHR